MRLKVPLFIPWISEIDKKNILNSLKSSQLTDGPQLRKFELLFSKKTGSRYAIGVSNATSALHLSLLSIGIGKGDEVIIPNITFPATANAVVHTGAKPVLADIDDSLNISISSIKTKISKNTRAIIPVHFAGLHCDMRSILKLAKKHNIAIIEDCAHSLGTRIDGKHVGTFGESGCFSFYPTKNITTIEGGMIITNSSKIAKTVSQLRNHGLTKNLIQRNKSYHPWIYDIKEPGYNYRLDEIRSALGISQLNRLSEIEKKRISAAKYYNKKLNNKKGIEVLNFQNKHHVYHLFIIKIKNEFGISRDVVHQKLFNKGIRTTVHYKPLHQFSYFKKFKLNDKDFPKSMETYNESLTLPLFPTITRKEQDYVIENLLKLSRA